MQDSGSLTPLGTLALAVLTPVVAWISAKLYDGIKTVLPAYDRLPALAHQIAAPLLGFLFGWLATAAGVAALTDIHGVTGEWLGGLLNVLLMAGIKRYEKATSPVDTTRVLETTRQSAGTDPR